jgi:hypothetical protein
MLDFAVANLGTNNISVMLNACVQSAVRLNIERNNSSFMISWPFEPPGFVLESVSNLSMTNWWPITEMAMTNNGRFELSVPADLRERYFRLRKQ